MNSLLNKKIPNIAGIYKFYNQNNEIIYIGKSKNLNKRINGYFLKNQNYNKKTLKMIQEIYRLTYTLSENEHDALLLENNLIKENKPKYNILLRDDKTYPYIVISKEKFPRIYTTRKINLKKEKVFGPFTNIKTMKNVLELIKKLYKIRSCTLHLSDENIKNNLFKVCLDYHIGNCLAPCVGKQKENSYLKDIKQIEEILKGNLKNLIDDLKYKMDRYSKNLEFENAQSIKNKISMLKMYNSKSSVVNPKFKNIDVFGIIDDNENVFLNYMKINNGIMLGGETIKIRKKIEMNQSVINQLVFHFRNKYKTHNYNIISNKRIDCFDDSINIYFPKTGDKKKLLNLSLKNAFFYKEHHYSEKKERKIKKYSNLIQLSKDLKLKSIPKKIECFDVSNTQGTNNVASMVSFINGYPSKKNYRKYKINRVSGINDYKSLEEVVYRRYNKLKKEKNLFPDLIIVDGGKGQLRSAVKMLKKLKIYGKVNVIGIAKKLEEIYFPNDSFPILIGKKSESLKLLQFIRNEAHRFAITFHKTIRKKKFLVSNLDEIPGIGEKTKFKLLKEYHSVQKIRESDLKKLAKNVGIIKAEKIIEYLNK